MGGSTDSTTNPTLLGRLARDPHDIDAWTGFAERYGRRIYGWAKQWKLQNADALDLTQSVLLDVSRQLATFERRGPGSFRKWLKTIAYRSWCDFVRDLMKDPLRFTGIEEVSEPSVGDDFLRELDNECEREMLEVAMTRVRIRVAPHTWVAFVRTAIDGASGEAVGIELGMKVGAVYVARSKVLKMLREEVARLDSDDDERGVEP